MTLDGAGAAAHVELAPVADARPHVALNMVESVDGRVTVGNRVGGLTSVEDQELLHRLREQADAVIVGAATVRTEGYGSLLPEEHRRRRLDAGRDPEPLLCVLTRTRGLPPDSPALRGTHRVLIATGSDPDELGDLGDAQYLHYSTPDNLTPLARLLDDLAARFGVRTCVCEGGPDVAREFIDADLCDDVFISVSPRIVGVAGRVGVFAPVVHERALELRSLLRAGDHVFLRYGLA